MSKKKTYSLTSPIIDLEWDGRPEYWSVIAGAWVLMWVTLGVAFIHAFSVMLPGIVGFETTVLIALAVLMIANA